MTINSKYKNALIEGKLRFPRMHLPILFTNFLRVNFLPDFLKHTSAMKFANYISLLFVSPLPFEHTYLFQNSRIRGQKNAIFDRIAYVDIRQAMFPQLRPKTSQFSARQPLKPPCTLFWYNVMIERRLYWYFRCFSWYSWMLPILFISLQYYPLNIRPSHPPHSSLKEPFQKQIVFIDVFRHKLWIWLNTWFSTYYIITINMILIMMSSSHLRHFY